MIIWHSDIKKRFIFSSQQTNKGECSSLKNIFFYCLWKDFSKSDSMDLIGIHSFCSGVQAAKSVNCNFHSQLQVDWMIKQTEIGTSDLKISQMY